MQLTGNYSQLDILASSGPLWLDDPIRACESWLVQRGLSQESITVYLSMWSKLLKKTGGSVDRIDLESLVAFLDEEGLESEQRYRYARMVERIFDHLAELQMPYSNPGRQACKMSMANGSNRETEFLSEEEIRRLDYEINRETDLWREQRDQCLAALHLYAGAKTGELVQQGMTVNCIIGDWSDERVAQWKATVNCNQPDSSSQLRILLPGDRRRTPRLVGGQVPILRWVKSRLAVGFEASLFPGTQGSGVMDSATAFRSVKRVLARAGIDGARSCGQTLRNTYVALLIAAGESDEAIMAFAGLMEPLSVARMRAKVEASWGIPAKKPAAAAPAAAVSQSSISLVKPG